MYPWKFNLVLFKYEKNMEQLLQLGVDFAPKEVLSDDKTTGWIVNDYV